MLLLCCAESTRTDRKMKRKYGNPQNMYEFVMLARECLQDSKIPLIVFTEEPYNGSKSESSYRLFRDIPKIDDLDNPYRFHADATTNSKIILARFEHPRLEGLGFSGCGAKRIAENIAEGIGKIEVPHLFERRERYRRDYSTNEERSLNYSEAYFIIKRKETKGGNK